MKLYANILALSIFGLLIVVFTLVLVFEQSNSEINSISGKVTIDTQVEVTQVLPKNCTFTLYEGWNMVSFYCFGMFVNRSVGLESLNDSYSQIFTYQSIDSNDPWKNYNRDLPSWVVQQVNYMDRVSGYLIYMENETNFTYNGVYSNSIITLRQGWNMIGYPKNSSSDINITLNGTSYTAVRYYDGQNDVFYFYTTGSGSNNLTQFETFKGYWINASSTSQLNITA
jgi:hypothetical protein